MEQTILTSDQKTALDIFSKADELRNCFYLSGGTALAEYYLKHRFSDDLDFFTDAKEFPQFAIEKLSKDISHAINAEGIEYRRLYDRRMFFFKKHDEVLKIEFTQYPFERLEQSQDYSGVLIDSLQDISANKLMALLDRVEPKDFVDIYFIVREGGVGINDLITYVSKKFGMSIDAVALGSEFAKVRNINILPNMIKPLTIGELKIFFEQLARELSPRIFD